MKDLNFQEMTKENRIAFQIVKESLESLESFIHIANPKVKLTAEGGIAIKLTNRTGAKSIKGYMVEASDSYDNAVEIVGIDDPDPIGVFYENSIADGSEVWVVVSGIADVYYMASTTHGQFARNQVAADGGSAGQAIAEAEPTSPFATDKHFQEIGHVLESRTGAGLAKTVLHFN